MIDSHAHIYLKPINKDTDSIVSRALDAGLYAILNTGVDMDSSYSSIELAEKYPACWAGVGIHPNYRVEPQNRESTIEELERLIKHPKVVAIGETGLDYYREYTTPDEQAILFRLHLDLARKTNYPVIIHIRDAYDDFRHLFHEYNDIRGVLHAFGGDEDFLDWALKNTELYFGIGGPVTFKNFKNLSVVEKIPLERLLLETDCPYLTPHPHRGKPNEPSYIPLIANRLAELHNVSLDELSRITDKNATNLFGIPKPIRGNSQVFLKSSDILDKIASLFETDSKTPVLEIGAGPATLTSRLKKRFDKLYAVEPDMSVYNHVDGTIVIPSGIERVSLSDISDYENKELTIYGNIPYHITTPILFQILENRKYVKEAALLIQKEVAVRLVADTGSSEYGVPTILLGNYYDIKKEFDVPAGAFRPVPDVVSAVITMKRRAEPVFDDRDNEYFEKIIRFSFTQRRKMLRKSLKQFINETISPDILEKRPEQMSIEDFALLAENIKNYRNSN